MNVWYITITILGSIGVAYLTATLTYLYKRKTDKKNVEYNVKLDIYMNFLKNFHYIGAIGGREEISSFVAEYINKLLIVAPIEIINCLYQLLEVMTNFKKRTSAECTILQHKLFKLLRNDLKFEDRKSLEEFTDGFKPLIAIPVKIAQPSESVGKKIKFNIKDVFDSEDEVALHILRLLMVANDIKYVWEKYLDEEGKKQDEKTESTALYLFRLNCSHLREAVKIFDKAEDEPRFKNLLNKLPETTKQRIDKFHEYYKDKDGNFSGFTKDILKPIRDNFFHYIDDELTKVLETLITKENTKNQPYKFSITIGKQFKDIHFRIADDISAEYLSLINKTAEKENRETLKDLIIKVKDMSITLMDIITKDVLKVFYDEYLDKNSQIEDVNT